MATDVCYLLRWQHRTRRPGLPGNVRGPDPLDELPRQSGAAAAAEGVWRLPAQQVLGRRTPPPALSLPVQGLLVYDLRGHDAAPGHARGLLCVCSPQHGYQPPFSLGLGFYDGFSPIDTALVVVSGRFEMF